MNIKKILHSFGIGKYYPPIFKEIIEEILSKVSNDSKKILNIQIENSYPDSAIDSKYYNKAFLDFYIHKKKLLNTPKLHLNEDEKIAKGYIYDKKSLIKSKFYIRTLDKYIWRIDIPGNFNYNEVLKNNNYEINFTEINKKLL